MKRTISIIVSMMCMATALLLTACHSNSSETDKNNASEQLQMDDSSQIMGTWKAIKEVRQNTDGEIIYEDKLGVTEDHIVLEFRSDGTFVWGDIGGEEVGNWSIGEKGIIMSRQYYAGSKLSPDGLVSIIDDRTIEVHFLSFENSPETGEKPEEIWTVTFERL